jgi:uncharacterized membrane protein
MRDLVFFLGRLHVLALHLPIGMLVLAVALDWFARGRRRQALSVAVPYAWGATALSATLTVVLGYMHFAEGGFTGPSAQAHRLFGTVLAVACGAVWWLSAKAPALHRKLNIVTGIVLLGLVTITGHYGGNLTHGSEYLVEYAPQPLRALAGLPERRPRVTDFAVADPWHDVVQPMLHSRCANCHNDDKRNGELSMHDYDALMRGGETGRVISIGNASVSELYRRITLPADDEAFMPAEGKTPLTPGQVEIVRWWIDAGAPIDTSVAATGMPADIETLLRAEFGFEADAEASETELAHADSMLVDALFGAGFLVRQVSESDPRLVVSVHSVGTKLDDEQLSALRSAADLIVSLDLQSVGLDDSALVDLDDFSALTTLRLSNNKLTDAAVPELRNLESVEVLNLYGNSGISDASLDTLSELASLRVVYLWGTGVTADGAERLRTRRPELEVN